MQRILGFTLSILIASTVLANPVQQRAYRTDRVLAQGEPALTQSMVDDVAGFFEWLFVARMTSTQRNELQQILEGVWQRGDKSNINGVSQLLELNSKVAGISAEQRESVRTELEPKMLETLRTPPVDDFSRLMLSVYENRSSSGVDIATNKSDSTPSSAQGLVGGWRSTSISMLQYQDTITKSTTPGRGSSLAYKFFPDGRFEFAGYMQTTMYNCTTTLYNPMSGIYRVDGSTLVLIPQKNEWQMRSPCYPSQNKDRPGKMDQIVYTWSIKQENGRPSLCMSSGSGGEQCYRRE